MREVGGVWLWWRAGATTLSVRAPHLQPTQKRVDWHRRFRPPWPGRIAYFPPESLGDVGLVCGSRRNMGEDYAKPEAWGRRQSIR